MQDGRKVNSPAKAVGLIRQRRHLMVAMAAAAALPLVAPAARAQASDYPNKPIRIVVPITAGSATDTSARFIANELAKVWNVTVTVDNKPGAGVAVGTDIVAKAPPDGYTLLLTFSPHCSAGLPRRCR